MPYEYRRLTPAEREEVVRQRRQRGYPLHSPPHPFRESGAYLITAATYEHAPIVAPEARRSEFEGQLLGALQAAGVEMVGWVVLPNHYHVLVNVGSLDDVSAALKLLHGSASRAWNLEDGLTGRRQVWYKFADRCMRDERQARRALNYVHYNPVRHGYSDDPLEWPWSSVHLYVEERGREWLREAWKADPPGDDGRGWDEG